MLHAGEMTTPAAKPVVLEVLAEGPNSNGAYTGVLLANGEVVGRKPGPFLTPAEAERAVLKAVLSG